MTALFFFNELEAATIEAVSARVFPGDPASPGAREAGVVDYIDRAIAGFSTELQPIYRRGIVELDRLAVTRHGGPFRDLTEEDQDVLLAGLDGSAHSDPGSGERGATDLLVRFFAVVREHTVEGMFGDPAYGGNRDAVGWRLIGFPGVASSTYDEHIDHHNVPYRVEPVSILDVQQQRVNVDSQGYPKHVKLSMELPEGGHGDN